MVALHRLLRFRPIAPDLRLRDGDTIGGLQVMHVAGHTAGSIALLRTDGVGFSGDALLSDKHGNILPPDPRLALDPAQASVSAETIKARRAGLLPAVPRAPASVSEAPRVRSPRDVDIGLRWSAPARQFRPMDLGRQR
jgi:glyoxylase-like metal-dependent hydrolase (beta-lactamase superfamily II)